MHEHTASVRIAAKYQHYRTKSVYTVLAIARHSETDELLVIYQLSNQQESEVWARPQAMFTEMVTNEEGIRVSRFVEVSEPETSANS
jgi:hypothetical protein